MRLDSEPARPAPDSKRRTPTSTRQPAVWVVVWVVVAMFALLVAAAPLSAERTGPIGSSSFGAVGQVESTTAVAPAPPTNRSMSSAMTSNNRLAKSLPWLIAALLCLAAASASRNKWRARSYALVRSTSPVSHLLPRRRGPPIFLT